MNFGKKLSTLINATLRGGLPMSRRRPRVNEADPQAQLDAVRQALADVEAKERAVADRLQETQNRLNQAIEQGDEAEVSAQRRLAHELESHLRTQSTEAIRLSEQLTVIEDHLAAEQQRAAQKLADYEKSSDAQTSAAEIALGGQEKPVPFISPSPAQDDDTSSDDASSDDDELADRKSRLSA